MSRLETYYRTRTCTISERLVPQGPRHSYIRFLPGREVLHMTDLLIDVQSLRVFKEHPYILPSDSKGAWICIWRCLCLQFIQLISSLTTNSLKWVLAQASTGHEDPDNKYTWNTDSARSETLSEYDISQYCTSTYFGSRAAVSQVHVSLP